MVKLEVGKFYVTRDGRKVGDIKPYFDAWEGVVDGTISERLFNDDGTHRFGDENLDLIAELTDTPAEVIGEHVRVIPINEVPDEVFERMAETRSKPYDDPRSKYHRIIKGVELDIYDILVAWGVTCPARQHAIKKLLMAGERGAKGVVQDLDEAIQATERAKELVG